MAKIQILDKTVANRISAGEVVERPSSVVKELFENSIDAGADNIIIEIEEGGIKKISITDNGCGIEHEDVKTAFMPHSTSKIKSIDDLNTIDTLGFRGEALASIASVSQVELITKTHDASTAIKIIVEGGEFGLIEEVSANIGTKITVKNLFYNTPARQKFLRKSKTEETEITNLIEKLMLSNPNISIKYITDGKMIYNTTGSGLYDIIYTIYGKDISNNLIPVNIKRGEFNLIGYIGKPEISKSNRTYQTLMINNRVVQNFLINNAVTSAYENYLMKNRFPFFVLNLRMPFDNVDVNVHPSKQEVKFERPNFIYSFFANNIAEILFNSSHIKSIENLNNIDKIDISKSINNKVSLSNELNLMDKNLSDDKFKNSSNFELKEVDVFTANTKKEDKTKNQSMENKFQETHRDFSDILKFRNSNSQSTNLEFKSDESNISKIFIKKIKENSSQLKNYSTHEQASIEGTSDLPLKIIGSVFNTYIITQKGDKLYIIDQHAGHERKLYDKFNLQIDNNNLIIQDLLVAYTFDCSTLEYQFFIDNIKKFENLGFYMEPFGHNNIKLTRIPLLLFNLKISDFIDEVKLNIISFNKKTSDILKEFIAQKACKSAVKAGDNLSILEINSLVKDLEKNTTLLCPHGRPIVIEISKKQLEKWFKRIV
ncbi:MAG: DNA mismatch repair endonuclease MutL [Clostridia bacterium]|nr:DNA mismatch repair endonuclease MutL [Clostridia bacterium]MDD4685685.1 DNA mismatch repair endonuclease MutL [Clostridia bacterium]